MHLTERLVWIFSEGLPHLSWRFLFPGAFAGWNLLGVRWLPSPSLVLLVMKTLAHGKEYDPGTILADHAVQLAC